jgi:hypothetical protein
MRNISTEKLDGMAAEAFPADATSLIAGTGEHIQGAYTTSP